MQGNKQNSIQDGIKSKLLKVNLEIVAVFVHHVCDELDLFAGEPESRL